MPPGHHPYTCLSITDGIKKKYKTCTTPRCILICLLLLCILTLATVSIVTTWVVLYEHDVYMTTLQTDDLMGVAITLSDENPTPIKCSPNYAIASFLTAVGPSASKVTNEFADMARTLAWSIRRGMEIDLILLVLDPDSLIPPAVTTSLCEVGWQIRYVTPIESPNDTEHNNDPNNPYLQSKIYTKLHIWNITDYDLILYLDSDTLVVNPWTLALSFPAIHRQMFANHNSPVAMTRDYNHFQTGENPPYLNAGVIMLIPGKTAFQHLINNITIIPHRAYFAEQDYLNAYFATYFPASTTIIPRHFNSMLPFRRDYPALWNMMQGPVILHYTIKPWTKKDCWDRSVMDICEFYYKYREEIRNTSSPLPDPIIASPAGPGGLVPWVQSLFDFYK